MVFFLVKFEYLIGDSMDKKKSILNVTVSIGFKLCTMVMAIVVKRILIEVCGNEVNGLNALYLSIIGFLSVAELGFGTAITFSMYKPIVEKNDTQVAALYHLFRKMYLIIGGVILAAGLMILPWIHLFAKDYLQLNVNLYLSFGLMLVSVVVTYLFSAKMALFNAYKNNYITTAITSGGHLLQYVLQIIVLLLTGSFTGYLICRIVTALVQWGVTEWLVKKQHASITKVKATLDPEIHRNLTKSIKAMVMHKVGYVLVNSVDSMVISVFVGVVALGEYSNYVTILTSLTGILSLIFTSLTSIIGHIYVSETKDTTCKYCEAFHLINFILGVCFFLGCYAVIDDLIAILFSEKLIVAKSISFTIILNGFVQFMRQTVLVFRDATGTFYNDRWKPLVEGVVNVIFSVLFVKWIGVSGVIAATIATNLLICHVIEPYVLYKNAFDMHPVRYYLRNYGMVICFVTALLCLNQCMVVIENHWLQFFVNGCISVGISLIICIGAILLNKKTGWYILSVLRRK